FEVLDHVQGAQLVAGVERLLQSWDQDVRVVVLDDLSAYAESKGALRHVCDPLDHGSSVPPSTWRVQAGPPAKTPHACTTGTPATSTVGSSRREPQGLR